MRIVSVRNEPDYKEVAVKYIHSKWGNETNYQLYKDSITYQAFSVFRLSLRRQAI